MKRNKKFLIFCFSILIAMSFYLFYNFYFLKNILTEKEAFIMVYGNYDPIHKCALWKNMNLPDGKKFDKNLWKNRTGYVSEVFFKTFEEAGKNKVFFITKTIPTSEPYECHACLPLLNATVFVKHNRKWKIESQNLFLLREGEYASSPITHLIQIGPDKYGVFFEFEHRYGEFLAKELYLIIPYKKSISSAIEETVYFDNFNNCGRGTQCASFSVSLHFAKTSNDKFYLLQIKRFGTREDEKQYYRAVPVDEESIYQFREGKYVAVKASKLEHSEPRTAPFCNRRSEWYR